MFRLAGVIFGAAQIDPFEPGTGEPCAPQIRARKLGALQIGLVEARMPEPRALQVGLPEVGASKIGFVEQRLRAIAVAIHRRAVEHQGDVAAREAIGGTSERAKPTVRGVARNVTIATAVSVSRFRHRSSSRRRPRTAALFVDRPRGTALA